MVRRYAVDSVMAGEPGPSSFGFVTEDEGQAIVEYRMKVAETCSAAYTSGRITSDESGDMVANAQSIMIAQLLALAKGMRISQTVGGIHHFIECIDEGVAVKAEVEEVEDPLVKAVRECDIDTAKKIMDERDKTPRADQTVTVVAGFGEAGEEVARIMIETGIKGLERKIRAEVIAALFEFARENHVKLPEEMTDFDRGERNGIIFSILVAAGVPYAVAGEMRPSGVWTNMHDTVKFLMLDRDVSAEETAYWMLDQPMPEAAPKTQPDFAEQIRRESGPVGGETRLPVNPWFVNEAKASVALDGETQSLGEGQTLTPEGEVVPKGN